MGKSFIRAENEKILKEKLPDYDFRKEFIRL